MLKPLPLTAAILMGMTACTGATDTPDPTETSVPTRIAETAAPPANTPTPEATSTPAQTPLTTPVPPGTPSLLPPTDHEAMLSSMSEDELDCTGEDPERMLAALTGGAPASMEGQARLVGCLDDDSVDQLFMAKIVPVKLGEETYASVQAGLDVIDPRAVMTAGLEGYAQAAMAGSMAAFSVAVACLDDEEWTKAAPRLGTGPGDREGMVCIMAALGGPADMATAMTEAMAAEEVAEESALFAAGLECGMEAPAESAAPQPETATPTPMPTSTMKAPTPSPTPADTSPTSTTTATTVPSTPAETDATPLVITVAEVPAGIPEYDRSDWKHWVDEDGDCQDARQEVLIAQGLVEITYEDDRQCRVATGRWWAPHLGHHPENVRHIDVDHHVPLKNAHLSGAWAWDAERRKQYANYREDPDHLIAISSRHKRSKGARGPEEWAPPDNSLWCDYATDWAEIKQRWDLTMNPREAGIVMDMLYTCENPPEVEVKTRKAMAVMSGEDKPEADAKVYASCEEAEAAG